ncbi:MAG: hypothetical protein GY822_29425 [Deltaproteobacteria bacterium]|nr:hypothetical protein [Deltaproteobacteria bacterium]
MTLLNPMTYAAMIPLLVVAVLVLGVLTQRLFTYAFLLGAHLRFWQYMRFKGRRVPHGGFRLLRYLWAESQALSVLAWWRLLQLLRLDELKSIEASKKTDWVPVVGIHGYTQNASNLWGIRKALLAKGRSSSAVNLGLPFAGIESYTKALQIGIHELLEAHPEAKQVDVVCHSMGGLVLRHLMTTEPELARRIRKVVTLGSPHHGTAAVRGPFAVGKDAQQMSRNHTFINTLPHLFESAPQIEHIAIAAQQDYIVYPRETSLPEGAKHVVLPEPGHAGLLVHQNSIQTIVDALS